MFRLSLSSVSPIVTTLLFSATAYGQMTPTNTAPTSETTPETIAKPTEEAADPTETAAEEEEPTAVDNEESGVAPSVSENPEGKPEPPLAEEAKEVDVNAVEVEAPPVETEPTMLPLKVGTDTWSRFEVREGYDNLGVSRPRFQEGDQTVFRARLTLQTNPLQLTDTISGLIYFAPQASGQWGTQGLGGTVGEANAGIYEGYVYLKGETLEAKIGRFAMNYGDALVIGNLDWHQAGRAFDGLHLRLKSGAINLDGFITQQSEGHPALSEPFLVGDSYFWGFYAQLGKAISEGLDLDAYLLGKSLAATDITTPDPNDPTLPDVVTHKDGATHVTIGLRAKQKVGILDYRVEAGLQMGKTVGPATETIGKFAYQADGELGVSFAEGLRLSIGGAMASGNDPDSADKNEAWDELYPTTHKWFGLMDVIGLRTNIASANLAFAAPITPSTSAQLAGHVFARLEDGGLGQTGTDKLAGYEIDAGLMQKIGKFAYARGLYGIFLPNSDHYATGDAAHFGEVQAGLKF